MTTISAICLTILSLIALWFLASFTYGFVRGLRKLKLPADIRIMLWMARRNARFRVLRALGMEGGRHGRGRG